MVRRCHQGGSFSIFHTRDRRQSKKIILSPDWRQMAMENTVSSHFDPHPSLVNSDFDCSISGVFQLETFRVLKEYIEIIFPF